MGFLGSLGAGESRDLRSHSSILQPPSERSRARPRARVTGRPPGSVAPLSLSRLRRCLPRRARGRAGTRRDARRSVSGGGRGPGARLQPPLAPGTRRCPRFSSCQSWGTSGDRRFSPLPTTRSRRQTRSGSSAPPHGGGGAEAQRAPEREERSSLPGGQRGSRKRNFSLPPPVRSPECAPSPAGGNCT